MNTIFMNSENSKTSDPDRLLFNLADKTNFREVINMLLYHILTCTIHGKISKSYIKTINLKYQLQHGIKDLNFLMDHILYQILKIILNIY